MRRINYTYLVLLIVLGAVTVGGVWGLHRWNKRRQAPLLLARAEALEAGGDLKKAAESYQIYLTLTPGDREAWIRYARMADRATPPGPDRGSVASIYEQAVRVLGEDEAVERRSLELALEVGRIDVAKRRLESLVKRLEGDASRGPEVAELEERLGRCFQDEGKLAEAERCYRRSIERAPGRVAVRERLAGMLRLDPEKAKAADDEIEAMVAAAERPAEALAARWRHRRDFGLEADPEDARKALELAPDDPGVRFVAARAALDANDGDAARGHLAEGVRLAPTDRSFPLLWARLESAAGRPQQAEPLLREALKAIPNDIEIQVVLAESLILQGKLDGEDGAEGLVDRLASVGLSQGHVRFLRAQALHRRGRWREAVEALDAARAALAKDPIACDRIDLMLAECHARLGADQESLVALRRAAASGAGGMGPRLTLAAALERAGKIDEALQVHRGLQADRPESLLDEVRLRIFLESVKPSSERSWETVEARLKAAEAATPDHPEAITLLRADLLTAWGRGDEAWKLLDAEARRGPDRLPYRLAMAGLALRGEGPAPGPASALAILDRAEQDLGGGAEVRRARIDAATALPREEARGVLDDCARELAASTEADRTGLLDRLASAYHRIGEFDKADELLKELGKTLPGDLGVLRKRADAALAKGDQARCREVVALIKEVEGEPGAIWRYVEASSILLRLADEPAETRATLLTAADALARDVSDRRKTWWGGPLLRGRLAELDGRLDDAAGDYAKAVELGAPQSQLASRTVLLLAELGRFQESDRVAQILARRDSSFEGVRLAAAWNALRTGDFTRAVVLTREVVSEQSVQVLDLLFLARVLDASGRQGEAEKPLARALELAPSEGMIWLAWVRHLVDSGRGAEVPSLLARAAKVIDPKSAPLALAIAQSVAGDDAEAASLFRKALEANPDHVGTIRSAAEFHVKVFDLDAARPLVDRLLDPRTAAGPETVAWARRASALFAIAPGDPRRIDEALALIDLNLKANPLAVEDQRARAVLLTMHPDRRDEGVRELDALHEKHRLSREDRFLLAKLHDRRGDRDRWRSLMAELMAEPGPEDGHIAAFARRSIELGDPAAAATVLAKARPRTPADELTLLEARCLLLRAEKREDEIPALVEAQVRNRPDQAGALAFLLESIGRVPDAERAFRAFAARAPEDSARRLVLARFLAQHDRIDEAVTLCEGAVAAGPHVLAPAVMNVLGASKAPTPEQRARLAALVEQAAAASPDDPEVLLQFASLRSSQGRRDEAEKIYGRILATFPDDAGALNDLAWLLGSQARDLDEALRLVDRALTVVGPDASLLDTRAMIRLGRKEPAAAVQDLDQAIALVPRMTGLHIRRAEALLMSEQPDEARQALEEVERLGVAIDSLPPPEREEYEKLARRLK
ncbi:tetratricopeptide repeat protein [Planctomyces sp. SH-PL62]|uniref:tetratricopeptide repeat protein n=1 Tax=Planctomyces sp. SH-PL62 TaxID=1636152 RepID=UPI00078D5366|nr:tetratricopeptide repeat protein [Planctomyces sp. SH-PL62]AMV37482.1 Tetratricopeptide repeat protein [Planctomyces sp. SH-PL62]